MSKREYKIIAARTMDLLCDELNKHGSEGWCVAAYLQEFGVTKILLEREIND